MAQSATDQMTADSLEVSSEQIQHMVDDLFTSMFSLDIASDHDRDILPEVGSLQASVRIEGSVNAEVITITSLRLAEAIACAMFETDLESVTGDEAKDAIGEVANIVGGNIKGFVNTPCTLTIPVVSAAGEIPEDARREVFRSCDSVFHVVVIQN